MRACVMRTDSRKSCPERCLMTWQREICTAIISKARLNFWNPPTRWEKLSLDENRSETRQIPLLDKFLSKSRRPKIGSTSKINFSCRKFSLKTILIIQRIFVALSLSLSLFSNEKLYGSSCVGVSIRIFARTTSDTRRARLHRGDARRRKERKEIGRREEREKERERPAKDG